ncbi:MAG: SH3 domain-containing protein [Clostridia bacterium]|nr:SH3 domain-containing protein [Clostridia bacterium]
MKARITGYLLIAICMFCVMGFSESSEWTILQPGWWNAQKEAIVAVRDQLSNHILMMQGQTVIPTASDSVADDDWSILQPGWWNASLEEIQNVEKQLTNHIDVLEGRLVIIGTSTGTTQSEPVSENADAGTMQAAPDSIVAESDPTPVIVEDAKTIPVVPQATPSPVQNAQPVTAATAQGVKIVSSQEVNIRSSPDTKGTIYGRGKPGEVFEYLGMSSNGWYKVRMPDKHTIGYISNKLAELTMETPGSPVGSVSGNTVSESTDLYIAEDDPNAYLPVEFTAVYNNSKYINRKVMVTGVVSAESAEGDTVTFTIHQTDNQNWEIIYVSGEDIKISSGDVVTVLGTISENDRIDVITKVLTISVNADFVEIQ